MEDCEGDCEGSDVTEDIVETSSPRAFVAVLGNGIADVVDRVVGQVELVAVCVQQLSIRLSLLIGRAHRRQRARRGRLTRAVIGRSYRGGGGGVLGAGGDGPLQDRLPGYSG